MATNTIELGPRRRVELVLLLGLVVFAVVNLAAARAGGPGASAPATTRTTLPRPPINGDQRPPIAALEQTAIERLAATNPPTASPHAHGDPHIFGPATEAPLAGAEQTAFDGQWAAARTAAARLASVADAEAAGYVLSSTTAPGVGVHYVNWTLIDRPFDPARPAMLLFSNGRLVGFSYWVLSDAAPDGFAGANDVWHTHHGLCVVNGWVEREDVADPADCAGTLLEGSNLWMLHAWVVPGFENRWGRFALTNPRLCPARASVPDVASCAPDEG